MNSNWDINKYRSQNESPRVWNLKKAFLETNKTRYSEERLECLTNVFINVEVLGSRYNDGVMVELNEATKEIQNVIEAYRQGKMMKFLPATDTTSTTTQSLPGEMVVTKMSQGVPAALPEQEQKVNRGSSPARKKRPTEINREGRKIPIKTTTGGSETHDEFDTPFGRLILIEDSGTNIKPRNVIERSAALCSVKNSLKVDAGPPIAAIVTIGSCEIAKSSHPHRKGAVDEAFSIALEKLREVCYTIKISEDRSTTTTTLGRDLLSWETNNVDNTEPERPTYSTGNFGTKMLVKMGWQGGGLGKELQGISLPIEVRRGGGRAGFGNKSDDRSTDKQFKLDVNKCLREFKEDLTKEHIVFTKEFTQEERAYIHQSAHQMALKSKSKGTGNERFLTISKKLDPFSLAKKLLECGGTYVNYELISPSKPKVAEVAM